MGKQRSCIQIFLAFILKFLNYLQTFMGISMILYSFFMLNHWRRHSHVPSNPPLASFPFYSANNPENIHLHDGIHLLSVDLTSVFAGDVTQLGPVLAGEVTQLDQVNSHHLPAPWFIYAFMAVGILLCLVTCIGHIAAETINGCCLCFYTMLSTLFILFEASLVAFIALDRRWEQDLPADSTGELAQLRAFIEEHMDVCKWVGIAVIIIQLLTFLVSIILRALVNQKVDPDDESVQDISGRPWDPLLHPHVNQASGSSRSDTRGNHSDIWSARIKEKYGLGGNSSKETHNV